MHFVDCGVSGGVWGKEYGYALMCGGDAADVAVVQPIFDALKPAGRHGFAHAGGHGAGHFAKMVHNGIEYSMMQAYAEGWELLEKAELVTDVPRGLRQLARGHGDPVVAARPDRHGAGARTRSWPRSAATPTTPARAAGRWTLRSTSACRCRR